jgi:hypothetical protein
MEPKSGLPGLYRKFESAVRYLGVDLEDALEIAEQTEGVAGFAGTGRDGFSDPPRPASN